MATTSEHKKAGSDENSEENSSDENSEELDDISQLSTVIAEVVNTTKLKLPENTLKFFAGCFLQICRRVILSVVLCKKMKGMADPYIIRPEDVQIHFSVKDMLLTNEAGQLSIFEGISCKFFSDYLPSSFSEHPKVKYQSFTELLIEFTRSWHPDCIFADEAIDDLAKILMRMPNMIVHKAVMRKIHQLNIPALKLIVLEYFEEKLVNQIFQAGHLAIGEDFTGDDSEEAKSIKVLLPNGASEENVSVIQKVLSTICSELAANIDVATGQPEDVLIHIGEIDLKAIAEAVQQSGPPEKKPKVSTENINQGEQKEEYVAESPSVDDPNNGE